MTKTRNLFVLLLLLLHFPVFGQKTKESKNTRVELKRADILGTNKAIAKDAKRLIGNVKLKQEDVFMYCDSVYLYTALNNFRAYGNVHLVKGDSIEVFSDSLYHYGNEKVSMFRGNVMMLDKKMKLYTDSLNYNMIQHKAYYFGGGRIEDSSSTLESTLGEYHTNQEKFFFKDSVVVTTEKYTMRTDTLEYYTESNMALFNGPTTVVSDTNKLYAEKGWYDTQKDVGLIHQNARYTNQNQTLDCDTLFYDRDEGIGEAFSNVIIKSLKDSINLTSEYAFYNENEGSYLATDSATLIQISATDTTYLHADTLRSLTDTIDGGVRHVYAYYHAQLYSDNIQMRSDSIVFSFRDSTVRLFGNPVIWSDSSQLKAKKMHFRIVDNELTDVFLKENSIIISENDTLYYNQIKGFEITGHLHHHELKKAIVNRRSETIYYLEEENEINSMNKTRCRKMNIYFSNGQVDQVVWISEPKGKIFPLKDLNEGNMFFNEFEWLDYLRPKQLKDIYVWKKYVPQ